MTTDRYVCAAAELLLSSWLHTDCMLIVSLIVVQVMALTLLSSWSDLLED
jgi:hypothetical protein